MGGNHATECRTQVMSDEKCIDFILAGEADNTFPEFIDKYFRGENYLDVPGLLYRDNGEIRENPFPKQLIDLDTLPFPAWNLYDMEEYYNIGIF